MTSAGSVCCHNKLTICDWCFSFNTASTPISTQATTLADALAECDATDDIISVFMRDNQEPENCSFRTRFVTDFCNGANLSFPEDRDSKGKLRSVALVNDIKYNGKTSTSLATQMPLDVEHLFEYLSNPKTHGNILVEPSTENGEAVAPDTAQSQHASSQEASPRLKLVFVADLDCNTVLAFIRTAFLYQAWVLRESIYNHLVRKPSIQATISRIPLPTFRLAMDLPYNALRECTPLRHDQARRGDGRRLRSYEDISFLAANPAKPRKGYYLYKVHFSGVVCGTHNSRWEAYGFGDTYFDDEESIETFTFDPDTPEQLHQDPLRAGLAADIPLMDPRHYFLDLLLVRSKRIKAEWRHLLDNMDELIEESELYFRGKFMRTDTLHLPDPEVNDHLLLYEAVHHWINHTDKLLVALEGELSSLTRKWEAFNSHINSRREIYFGGMEISAQHTIQEVDVEFMELNSFDQQLRALQRRCKKIESEMGRYFASLEQKSKAESIATATEMKELTLAQVLTGEHVKKMGSVMTVLAIFSLATQIFAIPKESNLVALHPGSALAMLTILASIAVLLHVIMQYQSRCIGFLKGKLGALAEKGMGLLFTDRAEDLPA